MPGQEIVYTIYPTKVLSNRSFSYELPLHGPVKNFTALLDLETGEIVVTGQALDTFFRYRIRQDHSLTIEKGNIKARLMGDLPPSVLCEKPKERLSLGSNKSQEWDMVLKRNDLKEILPILYHLCQWYPKDEPPVRGKCLYLEAKKCVGDKEAIYPALKSLIQSGFIELLVPTHKDLLHQGFLLEPLPQIDPFSLFPLSFSLIRSLFIQEGDSLHILPGLPKEFHSGRMMGVAIKGGHVDFEWSKKGLSRLFIHGRQKRELRLLLPKEIKRFRCNKRVHKRDEPLAIEPNQVYRLDRFEK